MQELISSLALAHTIQWQFNCNVLNAFSNEYTRNHTHRDGDTQLFTYLLSIVMAIRYNNNDDNNGDDH